MAEESEEQKKLSGKTIRPTSKIVSDAISSLGHVDTRPRVYFDVDFSEEVRNSDLISFTENLENRELLKLSVNEAKERGRIGLFLPSNLIDSIEIKLTDKNGRPIQTKNLKVAKNKVISTRI